MLKMIKINWLWILFTSLVAVEQRIFLHMFPKLIELNIITNGNRKSDNLNGNNRTAIKTLLINIFLIQKHATSLSSEYLIMSISLNKYTSFHHGFIYVLFE